MTALKNLDFIALSRRMIGLQWSVYWLAAAFYPFIYQSLFDRLGAGSAFYPFVVAMFIVAQGLLWGILVAPCAAVMLIHMVFMVHFDAPMDDLHWCFVGWVLGAHILLKWGVPRRFLLELGWWVGGVTFTLHGVGKLFFTGREWLNGEVVAGFMGWGMPRLTELLSQWGWFQPLTVVAGWLAILLHLAALPHALYRPGRPYVILLAMAFHLSIMLTPLYFLSFGFLAFWIFLAEGAKPESKPVSNP